MEFSKIRKNKYICVNIGTSITFDDRQSHIVYDMS
jgi:hypothetical protein